jgi:hypothetical protein
VSLDDLTLPDKIVALHDALKSADIQHSFGGALALAYYTLDPRTTADIDINLSVSAVDARRALAALPVGIEWTEDDLAAIAMNEQHRLRWGRTPIDLFFAASDFHDGVATRVQWHEFGSTRLPFLAARDLAIFKALFDRSKDWIDIAQMVRAESIDVGDVDAALAELLGDDSRRTRLRRLADE